MRILVDTNVIIDFLQRREGFAQDAERILMDVANDKYVGYISTKQLADIYYIMHHYTHSDDVTREGIKRLTTIFAVLDTTADDCGRALESKISDYEDAMMAETALRNGLDCIVTRNVRDYKNAAVEVYTPAEFLAVVNSVEA